MKDEINERKTTWITAVIYCNIVRQIINIYIPIGSRYIAVNYCQYSYNNKYIVYNLKLVDCQVSKPGFNNL